MPELEDLVNYAILIAVAVGVIFLITGKFIDLSIERQTSTQNRATINILQDIVTNSSFLMEDSGKNKLKLTIDQSKYESADFNSVAGCCDSVQYDYKFGVGNDPPPINELSEVVVSQLNGKAIPAKTNYDGPGEYDIGDYCYTGFGLGLRSSANVPVNFCDNDLNHCTQAIASVQTTNSPLSELSYWITDACNTDFSSSKRIPLAMRDYQSGDDLTIDNSKKEVCLHGTCKKFSCGNDVVTGTLDLVDEKNLWNQEVSRFPIPAHCNFAKVVSDGAGHVSIVQAKPPEKVSAEGLFFLPGDQDAWTEGDYTGHILSIPSNHPIVTSVENVPPARGKGYIALVRTKDESAGDISLIIQMAGIKQQLDDCKVGDSTVKCVDMNKDARNLDKINFQARLHFINTADNKVGYLTWKLFDVNGVCIQKNYGPLGFGKDDIVSNEWLHYTIDKSGADQNYGKCRIAKPNDFLSQIASGFGTDKFPSEFNWQIASIEFDACEKSLLGVTCAKQLDSLDALVIDNFYFEGAKLSASNSNIQVNK